MTCQLPLDRWIVRRPLPDGLQLEFCNLDDDRDIALPQALDSLSSQEKTHAMRFHFERDQRRYVRGRGFMRRTLGRCLGIAAKDVPLTCEANNKPALSCQGPGFNLSHSGGLAVLAIRDAGPVGVDLELADRTIDYLSVAHGSFQPHEVAALTGQSETTQRERFLSFWTAKEALMKLTGLGMTLDPKTIGLRLQDGFASGFQAPQAYRDIRLLYPLVEPGRCVAVAWGPA